MVGRVVSVKNKNTATVVVERQATHPLYKKSFIRSKKFLVDDRLGVKEGDLVEFVDCKPVSKNKHWRITKVIGKNLAEITEEKLKKGAEEAISEVMPEEEKEVNSENQEAGENVKTQKSTVNPERSRRIDGERSRTIKTTTQNSQPKAGRPLDEKAKKSKKEEK